MSPATGTESVDTASELAPLEPEWDELASRTGATPFMRPGWIGAWWRAFGAGRLAVLILRRQGRLAGVLPLASRRGAMSSTTNWHTPEFAPLAEDEDALAGLIEAALARARVRLDLAFLYEGSAAAETCARLSRATGFHLLAREMQRSPYLETTGEWATFESGLPSRKTSKYRRFRRRLDERGQVSIESLDGAEQLAERLREGLGVEAAGLEGRRGEAILARPRHHAVLHRAGQVGRRARLAAPLVPAPRRNTHRLRVRPGARRGLLGPQARLRSALLAIRARCPADGGTDPPRFHNPAEAIRVPRGGRATQARLDRHGARKAAASGVRAHHRRHRQQDRVAAGPPDLEAHSAGLRRAGPPLPLAPAPLLLTVRRLRTPLGSRSCRCGRRERCRRPHRSRNPERRQRAGLRYRGRR